MTGYRQSGYAGFALPTVMIASVVMLIVLLSGLVSASSMNTALRGQYQDKLVQEAAESGVSAMRACVLEGIIRNTNNPLLPGMASCSATSATNSNYLVNVANQYRSTFSVADPQLVDNEYKIVSTGTVELLRPNGTVAKTITKSVRLDLPSPEVVLAKTVVGTQTACGIIDFQINCWGVNTSGQMGRGAISSSSDLNGDLIPDKVKPLRTGLPSVAGTGTSNSLSQYEVDLAAGTGVTCAITSNSRTQSNISSNRLFCWGLTSLVGNLNLNDNSSTCPNKNGSNQCVTVLPTPSESTRWGASYYPTDVAIANQTVCVVVKQSAAPNSPSQIWCWGDNQYSQMAHFQNYGSTTPVRQPRLALAAYNSSNGTETPFANANRIYSSPSSESFCSITYSDAVYCWGLNDTLQTGTSGAVRRYIDTAVQVAQMPNNSSTDTNSVFLRASTLATNYAPGGGAQAGHTCAVSKQNPKIYCWGGASSGQLGVNHSGTQTPIQNATIINSIGGTSSYTALSVATARRTSCAVVKRTPSEDNLVYCWGTEANGELGNGGAINNSSAVPVLVANIAGTSTRIPNPSTIEGGNFRYCTVADTDVYCWGVNDVGQIGDGTSGLNNSANNYRQAPVRSEYQKTTFRGVLY